MATETRVPKAIVIRPDDSEAELPVSDLPKLLSQPTQDAILFLQDWMTADKVPVPDGFAAASSALRGDGVAH